MNFRMVIGGVVMAVLAGVANGADGLIEVGTNIEVASKAMQAAGYKDDGGLEIVPESANSALRMWPIAEGTLIMIYQTKDNKISRMAYVLMDERPKKTRKEFSLSVVQFSPASGELTIKAKSTAQTSKTEGAAGENSRPEAPVKE